ncbi:chorismate mutase [Bordetella genomosp. 1]|uniref:Bifunctional chorismate mutase/prephenate dehydratase n=1 Tax=Bordetella genomosp. 1 TaxID=1395607 RepID=A0A261SPW5_9BORD|nr:prephenate dehydratase [Bordetella genomosp. 1]MDQ8034953.1 prephenate dehydratase [Bordetella sp.]OZI39426.1 chorismate mutase [Bordetella genomosp. 1]
MDETLQAQLAPLRARIDAIDAQILDLLSQRARTAQEVGVVKHAAQADGPVLRPEREAEVIRGLQAKNGGPFPNAAVASVWTEIMSACRGLERGMTVAYLGPQGSFSEQAAFEQFGHSVQGLPCASFDEVFRAIEGGQADMGMVPVENSTEGAVNRSMDLLLNTQLKIMGERSLLIRHCLMTRSGTMDGITTISAHPQALAQCQGWLTRHYPNLNRVAAASNSEAARVAAEDPSVAAIAGEVAAPAWKLQVVESGIQDDPYNRTRFLAIGHIEPLSSGKDKTSLILAVPHRAGAVYEMLKPLAANGVSMTRFESRPARTGQWEYYFYVDVLGHQRDPQVATALAELQSQVAFLKILGSYPAQ